MVQSTRPTIGKYALGERIKRAAELSPEIEHVRIAMTAEKAVRPLILAVGSGKGEDVDIVERTD